MKLLLRIVRGLFTGAAVILGMLVVMFLGAVIPMEVDGRKPFEDVDLQAPPTQFSLLVWMQGEAGEVCRLAYLGDLQDPEKGAPPWRPVAPGEDLAACERAVDDWWTSSGDWPAAFEDESPEYRASYYLEDRDRGTFIVDHGWSENYTAESRYSLAASSSFDDPLASVTDAGFRTVGGMGVGVAAIGVGLLAGLVYLVGLFVWWRSRVRERRWEAEVGISA